MSDAGRHLVTVDDSTAGERLDRALAMALPTLTRSRVKALIESRRVALADGPTIEEPSRKVKTGERFIVDVPEAELQRRRAAWRPPAPRYERGYGYLFAQHISQANEGCDFDFLTKDPA